MVIGSAGPGAIGAFRDATGYQGPVLVDPSLATYRAAGLTRGVGRLLHPQALGRMVRAFTGGFRSGAIRGDVLQQGGTFVLGPGEAVHFEWRDRFSGDGAPLDRILAAIPERGR